MTKYQRHYVCVATLKNFAGYFLKASLHHQTSEGHGGALWKSALHYFLHREMKNLSWSGAIVVAWATLNAQYLLNSALLLPSRVALDLEKELCCEGILYEYLALLMLRCSF